MLKIARERITQLRRQLNISQDELAKKIDVSRTIIGNYERNTNLPSIDVIVKLARVFNVSVDYLIREGNFSAFDKDNHKHIEEIDTVTKQHLFFLIDNVIQNYKTKKAFS